MTNDCANAHLAPLAQKIRDASYLQSHHENSYQTLSSEHIL
jgi:hypothetical protein